LQVLRQYALHLLFMPPAPSPGINTDAQAPARNIFPFHYKPNTLDRDHIVVPAGWDSWGKISVLRDGFDAKSWGEAWERDLDDSQAGEEPGAKKLYSILVPDQGPKVRRHHFAFVKMISTSNSRTLYPPSITRCQNKLS